MVHTPLMASSQRGALSASVIIGGIVVLALVLVGGYYVMRQPAAPAVQEKAPNQPSSQTAAPTSGRGAEPAASYSGQVLAGTSAPLLTFNQADYDTAVADGKLVVLYFYANWCPICRAEFPEAMAAFNQLTSADVVGFRVNFNDNETDDSEVALARRFGVPYQHTKVFVKDGEQVLKSPEEWDRERYLDEIAKHL